MTEPMKDSVELVLDLLRENMAEAFSEYYDGDPDRIPEFNLPACVVTKTSDTETSGTVTQDDVVESLVIKAILNKKDDWAANVDPINMTEKKLRQLMEARDPTTGRFLPSSIKGAIRKGLDGDRRVGEQMSLEIGVNLRETGMQGVYLTTAEAHLTIQLKYSLQVI